MGAHVVWPGADTERDDLLMALSRNCQCTFSPNSVRMTTCPGHTALVEDQAWLDHLVFARRQRERLEIQEFTKTRRKF